MGQPFEELTNGQFASDDATGFPSLFVTEGHAPGVTVLQVRSSAAMHPDPLDHYPHIESLVPDWASGDRLNAFYLRMHDGRGLPFICLSSALETPPVANYKFVVHSGIETSLAYSNGWMRVPRVLPLHVFWPGFAINTVFYAVGGWLLFAAPFALRRWRRIRRGLCPKCAYDLRGTPDGTACPECGFNRTA